LSTLNSKNGHLWPCAFRCHLQDCPCSFHSKSFLLGGIMSQTKDIFDERLADDSDSAIVINLNNKLCKDLRKCLCWEVPYYRSLGQTFYLLFYRHLTKYIDNSPNELCSFTHYYLIHVNSHTCMTYWTAYNLNLTICCDDRL